MTKKEIVKLLIGIMLLLGLCDPAHAFSGKTHKALTDSATLGSATGAYLTNSLGIKQGLAWKVTLDQSILPAVFDKLAKYFDDTTMLSSGE